MSREIWIKVGKGLLVALTGAAATYVAEIPDSIDFGEYQLLAAAVASTLANLIRKIWRETRKS